MVRPRGVRDSGLLDQLEAVAKLPLSLTLWRVVRDGRDPLQCGRPGGRWDDGTFDVLYTSIEADGAISEMWFHLAKGQPVFPTIARYRLFELAATFLSSCELGDLQNLTKLGIDVARFGQASYAEREAEYPRSQEVGEYLHFLGADALIVPNARRKCKNAVAFCEHLDPGSLEIVSDHGLIDWRDWMSANVVN